MRPTSTLSATDLFPQFRASLRRAGFQGIGVAFLRIIVGYLWYTQLSWKVPWTTAGYNELHRYVVIESHYAGIGLYRTFVTNVILPAYPFVAYLTYFTEVFLAISLIFGLFTRIGGIVGTLWAAQLYIGLATAPGEWYWTYGMLVLVNAFVWIADSGRWLALDQFVRPWLSARFARVPTLAQAGNPFLRSIRYVVGAEQR